MIIYYSMIIWIMITWFFAMCFPDFVYKTKEYRREVYLKYAIFTMAYIIIMIGLRSSVGDTEAYIKMFHDMPTTIGSAFLDEYSKDRGFFALSILFKKFISDDYTFWLLIISCICGVAVAKTLCRYSENFFFSMYLFITMTHFVWMLNGMRQFIAVSLLFVNISLMKDRKFIKFLILTLLLSTIHITAIIMIPFYFFATAEPWDKRFWLVLIVVLIAGMSIDKIANTFSYVLEDSAYEGYLEAAAATAGSNIIRTVVAAAPPVLALICRNYIKASDDGIIKISTNMSFLSAALYFASAQSGGILVGRLPIYFDIYNLLLLPWLVEHCFTEQSKKLVYLILLIAYFAFFYFKVKIGMGMGYSSEFLGLNY